MIDSIATRFSELITSISGRIFGVGSLLQKIENYPKTVFTLLFIFSVPFTAERIWNFVKPLFESTFGTLEEIELKHSGKITLVFLAITAFFYWMMRRENVHCINDINTQIKWNGIPHRFLYEHDSFSKVISGFKTAIEKRRGRPGSSIFLWHEKGAGGSINYTVETLAELSIKGLHGINEDNCKILKLNTNALISECETPQDVKYKLEEIIRKCRHGNTFLWVNDFNKIYENLESDDPHQLTESKEARFAKLLMSAIDFGKLRVIFTGDAHDRHNLAHMESSKFFKKIEAPLVDPEEMAEFLEKVINANDRWKNFHISKEAIEEVVKIARKFDFGPELPEEIDEHVVDAIIDLASKRNQEPTLKRSHTKEERRKLRKKHRKTKEALQKVEASWGRQLDAARAEKQRLLMIWWEWNQQGFQGIPKEQVDQLAKKLLLLNHVLIPIYRKLVLKEISKLSNLKTELDFDTLITELQEHFRNILGPLSTKEKKRLKDLEPKLNERIKGRKDQNRDIVRSIKNWRFNPAKEGSQRPAFVLFLSGDSGTGKSIAGEILAEELLKLHNFIHNPVNSPNVRAFYPPMHRKSNGTTDISMMYQIYDHIEKNPTALTLIEEVEKLAPLKSEEEVNDKKPSPLDLLLQLFGDTKVKYTPWHDFNKTDEGIPETRTVRRRNHGFILTSNLCEGKLTGTYEENKETLKKEIIKQYGEAFYQRRSCVIPFNSLDDMSTEDYIQLFIDEYNFLFKSYKAKIKVDESLIDYFKEKAKDFKSNIRPLHDLIRTTYTDLLGDTILNQTKKLEKIEPWKAKLKAQNGVPVIELK
ncbi:MAG: hypothetical protein AB7H97_21760 [Pseudobdellovibrionaceae bacterium]